MCELLYSMVLNFYWSALKFNLVHKYSTYQNFDGLVKKFVIQVHVQPKVHFFTPKNFSVIQMSHILYLNFFAKFKSETLALLLSLCYNLYREPYL